ncbi:MAG: methylmalonyl-CoA mutase family protein [Conexivisphaera sp.]|jgi:methylmalonyl-CoA mutase N-terminal domain/subunit
MPGIIAGYWGRKLEELEGGEGGRRSEPPDYARWREETLEPWERATGMRSRGARTPSGVELREVYVPGDAGDPGMPGEYPYVRGVYPNMYRGRPWTMRMFSGYGTPEQTNRRLRYLVSHGETGLSLAFDMPTLYGYDPDHELAEGVVGVDGVSVSTLRDMEVIFRGIDISRVSTSMTINAPAQVLLAMYVALADARGVPRAALSGTTQTDMLKEFIAQKEFVYPPEVHMRLIRDMMEFCTREMPRWNWISVSGYHIREAGATALQEAAFTLADGFQYVEMGMEAGMDVDEFAPRISFFFDSGINLLEEVAKFRAARRVWATAMREKYGARDERSLRLRFHAQTSGYTLTWQQPLVNIVRTALEALAAVLGGTQSLHTNAYDEAYAVPTAAAAKLALRTQQVIMDETGVADLVDPLGGSYYVEWLTDRMEEGIYRYLEEIERIGGVIEGIRKGYFQREIARSAYERELRLRRGEEVMVGVNRYREPEGRGSIRFLRVDPSRTREAQVRRLEEVRRARDDRRVREALSRYRDALERDENVMPHLIEAVKAHATLQEIMDVGRELYGRWREPEILRIL